MKSIGRNSAARRLRGAALAAAALLASACAGLSAAREPRMSDPLLGLSYDTAQVRFESLPAAEATQLALGEPPQWLYARSGEGAAMLRIVAGFQRVVSDDPARPQSVLEPDFGAVLRGSGAQATVLGTPDALFYGDPPLLPPAELTPLLADAVQRYRQAWGGKAQLQAELGRLDAARLPAALRDALQAEDLHLPTPAAAR